MKLYDLWIPDHVASIAKQLIQKGFKCYLVGGAVRDAFRSYYSGLQAQSEEDIIEYNPKDHDLAFNGTKKDLAKLELDGFTIVNTGLQYGTSKAVEITTGEEVDVAIFRKDFDYDGRRPSLVTEAKTIDEDLARRDFRMNAIAIDLETKEIIDPFDGKKDIEKRIISTMQDPEECLKQDALRIIRAIRFQAVLGLTIDGDLIEAALTEQSQISLSNLSHERIRDELVKILSKTKSGDDVWAAFEHLYTVKVFKHFIPELDAMRGIEQNTHHDYDVWLHTMTSLETTPPDLIIRLGVLFHDVGKPPTQEFKSKEYGYSFHQHEKVGAEMVVEILKRLKFEGAEGFSGTDIKRINKLRIKKLVKNHVTYSQGKVSKLIQKLHIERFGKSIIDQLEAVMVADIHGRKEPPQDRLAQVRKKMMEVREALEKTETESIKDLKINGNDLLIY